ncbi:hybrid sensor histidine kinase/response regulator [Halodesulfovibrio aestuarii]|uniref:hybrid sensor histidine kinase/response regulator n=1 Tax=Halodesulfovibrio aestuarii TaxID=126333 RepID=UPI00040EBBDD
MLKRIVKLQFFPDSYTKNFITVSILLTAIFLIIFNMLYYLFAIDQRIDNFIKIHAKHVQVLATHLATPLGEGRVEQAARFIHEELAYKSTAGLFLYDAKGILICGSYRGSEAKKVPSPDSSEYLIKQPIYYAGSHVGTVTSIATFDPAHHHFLSLFIPAVFANLIASSMVVLIVIGLIVKTLLRPLRELSETARRVRVEQTYSLRAKREGRGELAELTDSFNSMLDHIEAHDMFLHSESRNLEREVLERTLDLEQATKEAERANSAKSEFIASVSHELRTPMNAILGMTTMLQTTDMTRRQREYAEIIAASSQSLLHLINGVLDLSKLEAKKLEIEETNFILRDVLDELAIIFTEKVAVKEMDLVVIVDEGVPPVLRGDSFRLKQILLNLVGNAFKFTDRGVVELRVALKGSVTKPIQIPHVRENDEVVQLAFSVKDTGIGIAKEAQAKLFETFVQADGSTSRQYGGTGLGLSIVAELVSLMKGSISVDSVVGKGSTFTAALPFAVAENEREIILPVFSGWRVLVFEPSIAARAMWRSLFAELGMLVVVLGSERQVLLQLEHQAPGAEYDLVVLGSKELLDMTGSVVNYLCQHPELKVLVAARLGDEALPDRECSFSMTDFLRRPVTFAQLKINILRALDFDQRVRSELAAETESLEGMTVLVVEDNPINQQVMREILEYLGVKVTIAKDGNSAIELLSICTYDLVLMDIQLPGMDGFTTTIRLREELELAELPVIAMTAHTLQEDRDRATRAGMDGYLTKPVELDALVELLKKYVSRKRSPSAYANGAEECVPSEKAIGRMQQFDVVENPDFPASLPGLSVAEGVERVGGKSRIYLSVAKTFVETYMDAATDVRALFDAEDWDGLASKAHTLAGASGNISANDVFACSAMIEREARTGSVNVAAIDALEKALQTACNSIKSLQ